MQAGSLSQRFEDDSTSRKCSGGWIFWIFQILFQKLSDLRSTVPFLEAFFLANALPSITRASPQLRSTSPVTPPPPLPRSAPKLGRWGVCKGLTMGGRFTTKKGGLSKKATFSSWNRSLWTGNPNVKNLKNGGKGPLSPRVREKDWVSVRKTTAPVKSFTFRKCWN